MHTLPYFIIIFLLFRFEAKHQYFKKLAQTLGNFINISKTLANRHQLSQAFYRLQAIDDIEFGKGMKSVEYQDDQPSTIMLIVEGVATSQEKSEYGIETTLEITRYTCTSAWSIQTPNLRRSCVSFHSIMVRPSCVLLLANGFDPEFLLVEAIYSSTGVPYMCGKKLQFNYFDEHYCVYIVEKTTINVHTTNLHYNHPYPMHLRHIEGIGHAIITKNVITMH